MRARIVSVYLPTAALALSLAACDNVGPPQSTEPVEEPVPSLPAISESSDMTATTATTALDPTSSAADAACTAAFDQPVFNETDRGGFSERAEASGAGQQLADEFVLSSDADIQRLSWSGSYYIFDLPASTTQIDFRIRLFDDAGGKPDPTPAYDEMVTAEVTNSGVIFQNRIIYLFEADLPSAMSLSGGVTYWISILEEDPSTSSYPSYWRWANSTTVAGDASALRDADGRPWGLGNGPRANLAVQLQVCASDPEVDVDIKPGSEENSVNLKSKGKIPVAILTTDAFDAGTVDPSTVTLGNDDGDDTPVAVRNNGSLMASLEDVDEDGDLDLMLHFSTEELVAHGDLDENTTELILNGGTTDGLVIHGSDTVTIVPQ